MKAMILAAGLGTRLKHLTANKPKALIEINGITLLERSIHTLIQAGVNDIIINVHHFAPLIKEFVETHCFDARISFSDESTELLDTGGGIKYASWFFNDNKPFFIYNVDIISDINLKKMYQYHLANQALATLAVRERETQRYLLFDKNLCLCGRYNAKTQEKTLVNTQITKSIPYAFSGIHILSPEIFKFMPEERIFSITDFYVQIAKNQKIKAYVHNYGHWSDLGKLDVLKIWGKKNKR